MKTSFIIANLLVLFLLANICFANTMIADVYVKIENGNASVDSILVSYGSRIFVPSGSTYNVTTYRNSESFSALFDIPKDMLFYDTPDGGGSDVIEQNPVELFLPYYGESQILEIRNGSTVILSTNLDTYLCNNNGICESEMNENALTCPADCTSTGVDHFCNGLEDGICDPDCISAYDPDCKAQGGDKTFEDVSKIEIMPTGTEDDRGGITAAAPLCGIIVLIIIVIIVIVFSYGNAFRKKPRILSK